MHPFRLLLPLLAFGILHVTRAQVFIPDTLMRTWLNESIPGIVDTDGMMDTNHPGIATCDTVNWSFSQELNDTLNVDLTGLTHLSQLRSFNVQLYGWFAPYVNVTVPNLPAELRRFIIQSAGFPMDLQFPAIESPLENLTIWSDETFTGAGAIHLPSVNDSISYFYLAGFVEHDIGPGLGHIGQWYISPASLYPIDTLAVTLPAVSIGTLTMSCTFGASIALTMGSASVEQLNLNDGQYTIISWPLAMQHFHNQWSPISDLPPLPESLLSFTSYGPLDCIPYLPNGLNALVVSTASCIPNIPDSLFLCEGSFLIAGDTILCSVLNSDCPGMAAAIAGRHVIDDNGNGVADPGEPVFPWGRVLIEPINAFVPAGMDGWWERGVASGEYTITPTSAYPYLISSSPSTHNASITQLGQVDSTNHFAYALLEGINDLRIDGFAQPPRPGFDNSLYLHYWNYGTVSSPATLQLTIDAAQAWVESTPPPTIVAGNIATWEFPDLAVGAQGHIVITLHTDMAVPLGTPVSHTAIMGPVLGDASPLDNTLHWYDTVVGSYDPNDKLLDIPSATPAEVQDDGVTLTYTIRFQNTGTYPAERVIILDTLSTDLQWETFELLSSSHPCDWYMLDGVLHFIFNPIQLPDSASDEAESHGYVRYRMRPSQLLSDGDAVVNIAHIVFDFNEPIVTPPATFQVDASTTILQRDVTRIHAWPNPTTDNLYLSGIIGPAEVRIRDIGGRLLQLQRITGATLIQVDNLAPGTYVLECIGLSFNESMRFIKR